MSNNPFLQPREFYQRDIMPVKNYVNQMTKAMMLTHGLPENQARELVIEVLKNKESQGINDPVVEFFGRDANGDRTKERLPLTHYLRDVVQNREILVPTLTAYVNPAEVKSPVAEFIQANVKLRSSGKKNAQKATNEGQTEQAFFWDTYQKNKKENNNSMSGAFATESSTFVNETGHNTLTSITRSMASIGNALNERIIGGNRHYRNDNIAFNNILAIVTTMDQAMVEEAVTTFQLHQPSAEETLAVLMDSLRYYSFDERTKKDLRSLLESMSPIERCAVSYTQDLYHLRQYNEAFVRGFIDDLSRIDTAYQSEDPIKEIHASGELTINYAHQVLIEQVKGRGKDYSKADKFDPQLLNLLAGVCTNINRMVEKYRSLINAFFLTKTVPCSTAYIQDMVRKNVVLSDTDSTMFSVDEWVNWYFGHLTFSEKAFGVAGAVMFLSTQCIAHCLAILSSNIGVAEEHLYTLAMKPEFVFPVFGQSPVSKHYFTAILVQEGAVYKDIKMEIKGVHNKSSAQPVSIIEPAQKRMEEIIRQVMAGKKISLAKEIKDVVQLEQHIVQSLRSGSSEFLKRMNIKESAAYSKGPTESNYAWYTCWNEVFAPKYGAIAPPPYDALKIPTIISSPTSWKTFVNNIQDKDLVKRLESWMESHNKKILKTFYISMDYVEANGIPEEILEIVDYKRIVLDLTNIRRMLLDTLGYILREDYMLIETL
jgi:hypothetical protein